MSYVYRTRGELFAAAADAPQRANDRAEYIREGIAAGVAAMYAAPVFCERFDAFACIGERIVTEYNGYTFTARLEHDSDRSIDDDDCHPAEFDAAMFGDDEAGRACFARALEARNAWLRDEWQYVGVVVSVARAGVVLDKHAASLWGIECNYPGGDGNAYLTVVAQELLPEAYAIARDRLAALTAPKACPHCGRGYGDTCA